MRRELMMTSDYEWEKMKKEKEGEKKERGRGKSIKRKSLLKNDTHIYADRRANCPFIFYQKHYLSICNEAKSATEN